MDEIDLAIIEHLKKDARTSFREIARKLKVSPDTIVNRFRMLQKGYNIRLNGCNQPGENRLQGHGSPYDRCRA